MKSFLKWTNSSFYQTNACIRSWQVIFIGTSEVLYSCSRHDNLIHKNALTPESWPWAGGAIVMYYARNNLVGPSRPNCIFSIGSFQPFLRCIGLQGTNCFTMIASPQQSCYPEWQVKTHTLGLSLVYTVLKGRRSHEPPAAPLQVVNPIGK